MYDILFKGKSIRQRHAKIESKFQKKDIDRVSLLNWEEHCIECAVPLCYTTCLIYEKREDLKCVRIKNGLVRDYNYKGYFNFGIACEFKKWGKLETVISPTMVSTNQLNFIIAGDKLASGFFYYLSKILKKISPKYMLLRGYVFYKNKFLSFIKLNVKQSKPDYFLFECFSENHSDIQVMLQAYSTTKILFSEILIIKQGINSIKIPYVKFNILNNEETRILVSPTTEIKSKLIFTWLDFVKVKEKDLKTKDKIENLKPAEKVKCVAWDLDNTLWNGVLIEDGQNGIQLNENAIEVIKKLDERGIINTIVSKNSYEDAYPVLEKLGIADYFVYPAINWGQKSENLKQIAKKLNIGIDTFAFIDDNVREREEVRANLPMIRIFNENQIDEILNLAEFDVPITEMSKKRRLSYLTEAKRDELKQTFNDNYDDYIKNLDIKLEVSNIDSPEKKERCFELLSRSNQLNLSTNRYTIEEYDKLLIDSDYKCFSFNCTDKYGDYGLVGFISVKIKDETLKIVDLVISCRVAKKKVENAMVFSLKKIADELAIKKINALLKKTTKNKPIADVFDELPFVKDSVDNDQVLYCINDTSLLLDEKLIETSYKI
ncbi:HAD-IIIC family phosphatase [Chryseobacterium foetidum]|uniref:HAD-IIIC family phosphatase n=1 Tax=Chryseobacterium foetidum TaxID=2951057 RepID=UPI0021C8D08A|nr:HAD-IIIC family phosphatase [Chryseobacterium foetidum]